MKKTLFLSLSALCALTMVIPSCRKEPVPEPVYTLTVKTGAADVDETDVTLNGSYTYDGTETVTVGFRYAADNIRPLPAQRGKRSPAPRGSSRWISPRSLPSRPAWPT